MSATLRSNPRTTISGLPSLRRVTHYYSGNSKVRPQAFTDGKPSPAHIALKPKHFIKTAEDRRIITGSYLTSAHVSNAFLLRKESLFLVHHQCSRKFHLKPKRTAVATLGLYSEYAGIVLDLIFPRSVGTVETMLVNLLLRIGHEIIRAIFSQAFQIYHEHGNRGGGEGGGSGKGGYRNGGGGDNDSNGWGDVDESVNWEALEATMAVLLGVVLVTLMVSATGVPVAAMTAAAVTMAILVPGASISIVLSLVREILGVIVAAVAAAVVVGAVMALMWLQGVDN